MTRGGRRRNFGPYGRALSTPSTFGERIKATRLSWGITQIEFGKIINVNHRTISRWENANNDKISIDINSKKLSELTGINFDTWITGIGWHLPDQPANLDGYLFPNEIQEKILLIPDSVDEGIFQIFPEAESDFQKWTYDDACAIIKAAIDRGEFVGFFIK